MRNLVLGSLILGCVAALSYVPDAWGAETYQGTIYVTDAGCSHNLLPLDGGAFAVPALAKVTVQPNANAYVCVDELSSTKAPTCSSAVGVKVSSDVAFPSSCKPQRPVLMADGGYVTGCVVMVCPVSGTSVTAPVWTRVGDEF